jgi:drug/metabolite transporter (DMT)-like permease
MIGYLYAILAMTGLSFSQIFNKKLTQTLDVNNALLLRYTFTTLLALIASLIFGNFSHEINFKIIITIILGGTFGIIALFALFKSFEHTPIAISMTIANIFPFFILLFSMIFLKEYITIHQFLIMILIFAGIYISMNWNQKKGSKLKKAYLPLITALGWGVYNFSVYILSIWNIHPYNLIFYLELVSLIIFAIYFKTNKKTKYDKTSINTKNIINATICSSTGIIAISILVLAYQKINSAIANSIVSTQIILVAVLSIPIFGEKLKTPQYIGILIVLIGLILFNLT